MSPAGSGPDARFDTLCTQWQLTPVSPPAARSGVLVMDVTRGGHPLELRLGRAGAATEPAARALREWSGRGTPQLVAALPSEGALLTERPGVESLAGCWVDQAGEVIASLCESLHRPGLPGAPRAVPSLAGALGQPAAGQVPRRLLLQARSVLSELEGGAEVLLHGNLASHAVRHTPTATDDGSARWIAVDPTPRTGPAALDLYPFVREEPVAEAGLRWSVRNRIDVAGAETDPDVARGWLLVQACAEAVAAAARRDGRELSGLVALLKALAG